MHERAVAIAVPAKRMAFAVVAHEPDLNGEIRARVQWINGEGGVAMSNRMDEGEAAAFAAEMRGRLLARKQRGGRAPARVPSVRAERPTAAAGQAEHVLPVDDSDIPF